MKTQSKYTIHIANDFSRYPAGRYRSEGKDSGEVFLVDHLIGNIIAAISEDTVVEINLDEMNGYPSSFISGSFGKLSYQLGKIIGQTKATELLKKHIRFICTDSAVKEKAILDEISKPITK